MKLPQHSLLLFDKLSSAFSPNSINSVWRAHARRHPDRARRHQVAGGREPAAERAGLRQAHVDHGPEEGGSQTPKVRKNGQCSAVYTIELRTLNAQLNLEALRQKNLRHIIRTNKD